MFACVSVCACAYALSMAHTDLCMSVCLSSFNEAPQIRLIEPLVHHWTSHSSDPGQCAPPPRATELTNAAYQMVETDALSSARSGTKDKKWWPLIPNRLESGVYVLFCLCQSDLEPPVDLGCSGYVSSFVRVCYVCVSKVERCGVSKEFSVSEVSESRLFDSTPLWLGEFPLQFPSAEPMLGKESRARKIYVDVSNENTTIPPPRLTIFVKQRSVRSFSLSLRSLLSPWIFPFLLMYVSENLNSCWRGVSHFTWFVVSAGTLVTQLSIGLLRGWASLGVSLKV